ncbi:MAG: flagellar hook-length control protein FliK [Polaromonas sp.]
MSLLLPSLAAPATAAKPGAKTPARSDPQDQGNPGSFGEALARSQETAGEQIGKPAVKTVALASARRQAGEAKPDADELVNALGLPFIALESRIAKAVLPAGAGSGAGAVAVADATASGAAVFSPNPLLARVPAAKSKATAASAASGEILPNNLLAKTPGSTVEATEATDATAATAAILNADPQSTQASALAAASQASGDQTPLPATNDHGPDGAVIPLDPLAIAVQAETAHSGLSGEPSQRGSKDVDILGNTGDAGDTTNAGDSKPGLTRVSTHSASKVATNLEATALPLASSAVVTESTVSTSAALPANPAIAAVQSPGGTFVANAPDPIVTARLAPEVGNSEWGKALGQQLVHMGHAGQQVAELQLNPPGLGPLKVTLSMNDHQIQAMFVSAHASVRAAVEAALPQLRATLAESGINLGNTSVGAENQQQQQQQQQTAFANGQGSQSERGAYRQAWMADTAAVPPARNLSEPARSSSGLRIDTYA